MLLRFAAVHSHASAGKRPLSELDANALPSVSEHGASNPLRTVSLLQLAEAYVHLTSAAITRAGHSAKKSRAGQPEATAAITQQSHPHDGINAGRSAADAWLQLPEASTHAATQRASQARCQPGMAANPSKTQMDDVEWLDDDDPLDLLKLVMDTQPALELDGPTDISHESNPPDVRPRRSAAAERR